MATPDFVLALRDKVGHLPLWLSGVSAIVLRDSAAPSSGQDVLLVRRADNGQWTPVTGIIDPGEEPALAAERETLEEADIVAVAEALCWVHVIPLITYENGDQSQYLDVVLRLRYISGEPHPADGENTAAQWFALDSLPPMSDDMIARVRAGVDVTGPAQFER